MGIDGFSMSNLGLNRNLTSAQLANEAEMTANQALENQIADVDGVGKKEKAGRKDPDAAFNGTIPFIGEPKEKDDEENPNEQENEPQQEQQVSSNEEDDDEGNQYHFKLNNEGLIEVWDSTTDSVVKTISPEEAANVLHNFAQAPGIFVNREI